MLEASQGVVLLLFAELLLKLLGGAGLRLRLLAHPRLEVLALICEHTGLRSKTPASRGAARAQWRERR